MQKRLIVFLFFFLFTVSKSSAQVDTIRIPDQKLNTQFLKPGMNQYLITVRDTSKLKSLFFWYWLRDIKVGAYAGKPVFEISQHWYGSDTLSYRTVYSINRRSDFGPVYHSESVRGKTNAYKWNDNNIKGADSIVSNTKKGFELSFQSPNLNWNLDIETFEMLPLAAGRIFAINFYDAGLDPPLYIIYKVTGSEIISYGNKMIDCWKLYTEGVTKNGKFKETYWISKKNHEFLKEEDEYGSGLYRSKIKMPINILNTGINF